MAFVTKKEISSRWQIIFKEAETKLLLNLECKEVVFFSPLSSPLILQKHLF